MTCKFYLKIKEKINLHVIFLGFQLSFETESISNYLYLNSIELKLFIFEFNWTQKVRLKTQTQLKAMSSENS